MWGAHRVLTGTLLACLIVSACAEVDAIPTSHPRVPAPPGDAERADARASAPVTREPDAASVEADPRRPSGWPEHVVIAFEGAAVASAARATLTALIEDELHLQVAIVTLGDGASSTNGSGLAGIDVVVADARTAHAAGFDGRLHTVQGAVTGRATAWVTLAPDVWCPRGVTSVEEGGLTGCVEGGTPAGALVAGAPPGGLSALDGQVDARDVVVPSSTAGTLAMLQFERELGRVPVGLVEVGSGEPAGDALWLVPVEQGRDGVVLSTAWGPDPDGDPVVVAWGPWVPHAVVAVGPGVAVDLADAIDETLQNLSGRMEAAAALIDLAGVEGFATLDEDLWDALGDTPSGRDSGQGGDR